MQTTVRGVPRPDKHFDRTAYDILTDGGGDAFARCPNCGADGEGQLDNGEGATTEALSDAYFAVSDWFDARAMGLCPVCLLPNVADTPDAHDLLIERLLAGGGAMPN